MDRWDCANYQIARLIDRGSSFVINLIVKRGKYESVYTG